MPNVLTPPADLTAEQLSTSLAEHWELGNVGVTYTPLGHGSHNWTVTTADDTRWFAKVYSADHDPEFFEATARSAAALREAGLDFVVGPIRDRSGEVRRAISPTWTLSLFPYVEGRNPDFTMPGERAKVAEALGRLHAYDQIPDSAVHWEPGWFQPELKQILADELDRPWSRGPYGESARALFVDNRRGIERLFTISDDVVTRLAASGEPYVMTHGEPHDGNTMLDSSGTAYLIDCDGNMYAPRERDLRLVLHASHEKEGNLDTTEIVAAYQRGLGRPVQPRRFVLDLFRVEWHLIEIARYARLFSGPHEDTADVRVRWDALRSYLPVEQNWP